MDAVLTENFTLISEWHQSEIDDNTIEIVERQTFKDEQIKLGDFIKDIFDDKDMLSLENIESVNDPTTKQKEVDWSFTKVQVSQNNLKLKEVKRNKELPKINNFSEYYKDIVQFNGEIQKVNRKEKTFTALLVNDSNRDEIITTEFDFEDVQFKSDIDLIEVGAQFYWMFGKKAKLIVQNGYLNDGQIEKVSLVIFKRNRTFGTKEIKRVESNANRWTKLFLNIIEKQPTKI